MNTMKSAAAFVVPVYVSAPLGLLGGLLRRAGVNRDGEHGLRRFPVVGQDREGRTMDQQFEFMNQKPTRQVCIALAMVSGLAIGENRRPVDDPRPGGVGRQQPATGQGVAAPAVPGTMSSVSDVA